LICRSTTILERQNMFYVYCRTHRTTPDYQHVSLRHNRDGPLSATSMRTRFAGSSIFLCCCLLYEGMIALQCPSEQLSRQSVCGCLLMQSIAFTLSIAISMKTLHLDHISEPPYTIGSTQVHQHSLVSDACSYRVAGTADTNNPRFD
jgi:hypothetical protein